MIIIFFNQILFPVITIVVVSMLYVRMNRLVTVVTVCRGLKAMHYWSALVSYTQFNMSF